MRQRHVFFATMATTSPSDKRQSAQRLGTGLEMPEIQTSLSATTVCGAPTSAPEQAAVQAPACVDSSGESLDYIAECSAVISPKQVAGLALQSPSETDDALHVCRVENLRRRLVDGELVIKAHEVVSLLGEPGFEGDGFCSEIGPLIRVSNRQLDPSSWDDLRLMQAIYIWAVQQAASPGLTGLGRELVLRDLQKLRIPARYFDSLDEITELIGEGSRTFYQGIGGRLFERLDVLSVFELEPKGEAPHYLAMCDVFRDYSDKMPRYARSGVLVELGLIPCPSDEACQERFLTLLPLLRARTIFRYLDSSRCDAFSFRAIAKWALLQQGASFEQWAKGYHCPDSKMRAKDVFTALASAAFTSRELARVAGSFLREADGVVGLVSLFSILAKHESEAGPMAWRQLAEKATATGAEPTAVESRGVDVVPYLAFIADHVCKADPAVASLMKKAFKQAGLNRLLRQPLTLSALGSQSGQRQHRTISQAFQMVSDIARAVDCINSVGDKAQNMPAALADLNSFGKTLLDVLGQEPQTRVRALSALCTLMVQRVDRLGYEGAAPITLLAETGKQGLGNARPLERVLFALLYLVCPSSDGGERQSLSEQIGLLTGRELNHSELRILLSALVDMSATGRRPCRSLDAPLRVLLREMQCFRECSSPYEEPRDIFRAWTLATKMLDHTQLKGARTADRGELLGKGQRLSELLQGVTEQLRKAIGGASDVSGALLMNRLQEKVIATWKDPSLLLAYSEQHKKDPALQAVFSMWFRSLLGLGDQSAEELRYEHRDNRLHLDSFSPSTLDTWRENTQATQAQVARLAPLVVDGSSWLLPDHLKLEDTDRPEVLFRSGEDVGSCQSVSEGDVEYNRALLGYVVNGNTKLITVSTKSGQLCARAVLRLLLNRENKPVLLLEEAYNAKRSLLPSADSRRAVLSMARIKAGRMGLPLLAAAYRYDVLTHCVRHRDVLSSKGGLASCVYVDSSNMCLNESSVYSISPEQGFVELRPPSLLPESLSQDAEEESALV